METQAQQTQQTPRLNVDEYAAAEAIGVSVFFLRKDRRNKRLIPFYRIGDRVLYNLDRVKASLVALEEGGPAANVRARRAR